jgi:membrane-bound lytic murein transglycosylase B
MIKHLKKTYASYLLASLLMIGTSLAATSFSHRADVSAFIDDMVKNDQFDRSTLTTLFDHVTLQPEILVKMSSPIEAKSWDQYSRLFITEKRIAEGVSYWTEHADTLAAVEKQYGVPTPVIVSILGIETNYGKTQGNYPVFDTLTTLAFDSPSRNHFFKSELKHFLLLARENHFDPNSLRGSYAGAIGQPQFMPSSYRQYAVDFKQNQQKDLLGSSEDSIASIANFLKKHGWQPQQQIVTPATLQKTHNKKYLKKTTRPKVSVATLEKNGIQPQQKTPPAMKAMVITLNPQTQPQYWLGFENFYVIMRYNPRVNYAMAVYQLSEKIRTEKAKINS